MAKVKTIKAHPYAGKPRNVGEIYECEERYVKLLTGIGNVEPLNEEPPSPAQKRNEYNRRDMKARP